MTRKLLGRTLRAVSTLDAIQQESDLTGLKTSDSMAVAPSHPFQSQAAPRTPLESPCLAGRIGVTKVSEKT